MFITAQARAQTSPEMADAVWKEVAWKEAEEARFRNALEAALAEAEMKVKAARTEADESEVRAERPRTHTRPVSAWCTVHVSPMSSPCLHGNHCYSLSLTGEAASQAARGGGHDQGVRMLLDVVRFRHVHARIHSSVRMR